MLEAAQDDAECRPNTITYRCGFPALIAASPHVMLRCELSPCLPCDSSLISACERGGRLDRALEWFDRMKDAEVAADGITYRCADHMQV